MANEMSFDKEDSMRGFSFMDQSRIISLNYISKHSQRVLLLFPVEKESQLRILTNLSNKELTAFAQNEDYNDLIGYSNWLSSNTIVAHAEFTDVQNRIRFLKNDFNLKEFNESLSSYIGLPVTTWKQITRIFYFAYTASVEIQISKIGDIIDYTARYIHAYAEKFIEKEGWKACLKFTDKVSTEDISSSMVVISKTKEEIVAEQKAYEAGKFDSPPDTPPYTVVSQPETDDERDSLNTPPELVEKSDIMTDSLIKARSEKTAEKVQQAVQSQTSVGGDATNQNVKAEPQPIKKPEKKEPESSFLWDNLPYISITVLAISLGIAFFLIKRKS